MKLTSRFSRDPSAVSAARAMLAEYAGSSDVELQSRSVEFGAIVTPGVVPGLEDGARR